METAIFCLRNLLLVVKKLKVDGNQIADEVIRLKKEIDVEFESVVKTKGGEEAIKPVCPKEAKVVVHDLRNVNISTKFMKNWFKLELEIDIDVTGVSLSGKKTPVLLLYLQNKTKVPYFAIATAWKGRGLESRTIYPRRIAW